MTASHADEDFGLWGATAAPAPDTPALPGSRNADVVVIGAGYTGLSTALHAAKAGLNVVVVDREAPGFGASGRNGGQVIPGFKTYPDHLIRDYGAERGAAMIAFGAKLADNLFRLVAEHGIDCDAVQDGWIHAGHHPSKLEEQRWKHDQWARRGADVRWLDRDGMTALLGTPAYVGGWIDRRGGTVQPLSYARGLARAAQRMGATLHGQTNVTAITADAGAWRVSTDRGELRARQVVVATNGYTGKLVANLAPSIVTVESAQIATAPLGNLGIMPTMAAVSDTRRSLLYFRRSPDGRLIMGGRGGILGRTGADRYARLQRRAIAVFPELAGAAWPYRWAGRLAVTLDHMPHLHEPAPGLIASLGCNGRGVSYTTGMGAVIAARLTGAAQAELPIPFTPISPMPLWPFRRLGAALVARYYEATDPEGMRV